MRMITLSLALALSLAAPAQAGSCGFPPFPPMGCHYVCICDENGNCRFVLVCDE